MFCTNHEIMPVLPQMQFMMLGSRWRQACSQRCFRVRQAAENLIRKLWRAARRFRIMEAGAKQGIGLVHLIRQALRQGLCRLLHPGLDVFAGKGRARASQVHPEHGPPTPPPCTDGQVGVILACQPSGTISKVVITFRPVYKSA